jgi:glycylpeptide N-tetradecanoyltransferase
VEQTVEEISKTPYKMGGGMEWGLIDIHDPAQCEEMYTLLTENYVEDDEAMFRFDYSIDFLKWALTPPGYLPELHLGVRSIKSGKLKAMITGVPAHMRVHENKVAMVEINFLCIHKELRSRRLAPVLIKEITRRVNVNGVFQAVYTAGVMLPSPVAQCRYWHRNLNPKKLIEIGFTHLSARSNMARTIKLYKVAESPKSPGIQPMDVKHIPSACKLLNNYLATKCKLSPIFTEAEFAHQILPREGVVNSYVIEDPKTGEVTDMCSFYHLPSSIMKHPKHKLLRAAYSFYNVATTVPLKDLMMDLLILAKQVDMDVFNALDLMENAEFLKDLKFGIGDGNLQYYLFNYKTPELQPSDIGLVLL